MVTMGIDTVKLDTVVMFAMTNEPDRPAVYGLLELRMLRASLSPKKHLKRNHRCESI